MTAWTTPPSFAAAAMVSSASLQKLADDLNFLAKPPRCSLSRSAAKGITSLTPTFFDFDQEVDDTDSMHSNVSNNTRITFKTAGWYDVGAAWQWANNTTGRRFAALRLNGVAIDLGPVDEAATGGANGESKGIIYLLRPFLVNDYIELIVDQDSGGALNVTATMTAHWRSLT